MTLNAFGLLRPVDGEAALDVVEQQAERLSLPLRFVLQHRHERRRGHGAGRLDDEIRLARDGDRARLAAAMAVRLGKRP